MNRFLFLIFCLLSFYSVCSQKIPLINSGQVIEQGRVLYDSGKYEAATSKYLTISKRDTNYVYMLSELAITYNADKKYDKAIEVCNEGLAKSTNWNAHFLNTRAVANDKKGNFDDAVRLFNEAIEKYPYDHTLTYNLGITYYNHKDYDKAEKCFFKVLSFNPFHSGSHFSLARMAMAQGRRTHAMFAMGLYLSINETDNDRLVLLNKFLGNELASDEGTVPAFGTNACEKLDQIVKSKIAMDKSFDSQISVDAPVVKQMELLFNQLGLINSSTDDAWVNHYLPVYKAIKDKNLTEPFMYNMISSANIDGVKKWVKKNDKRLKEFYNIANEEFSQKRKMLLPPAAFGYKEPVQALYRNNRLEALGKQIDKEIHQGQWYYYYDNAERSAEGKYDQSGKKIGTWKYYYKNASIKSIENEDTGEITLFYQDGGKKEHFFLKNGQVEGEVEIYYTCGQLREKLNYKAGKRSGKGQSFYAEGQKFEEYNYLDNKLDGDVADYYANGNVSEKKKFLADAIIGTYQNFHPNSKIKSTGEFVKGEREGAWKYYHSNGQLEKNGTYKNGIGIGEWVFYDAHGAVTEKRNFDQAGKLNGENSFYYNGKPYYTYTYKNGVLVKTIFFDKAGKQISKSEGSNGTFAVKGYYAQGQLANEGSMKKGKMDGRWVYYYPDGSKWKELNYTDDLLQGDGIEYFKNGAKQFITHYKDGDFDGYFQEFYKNGQVKREGWFVKGQYQQQWLSYYPDGKVDTDYYYLNGQLQGENIDYNVDGIIANVSNYRSNDLDDTQEYNSQGKRTNTPKTEGAKRIYDVKFASGKPKARYEIQCGNFVGKNTYWFPNGNLFYSFDWLNGKRNGQYIYNTTDNKMEWGGTMVNGEEEGIWSGYSSVGKLESSGKFLTGQRDSIWNYFYYTGKTSSTAYYRNGERDDASVYYAPDGTFLLQKLFENGQMVAYRSSEKGEWIPVQKEMSIVVNYANGTKAYEEQFKNGLANGAKKIYYNTGKVYSEYSFIEGDYEGNYALYYPNGKPMEKGTYKNDLLTGTRQFFNEDGSLLKSEEYVKGVRHGSTIKYNKGAKVSEVVFSNGIPEK